MLLLTTLLSGGAAVGGKVAYGYAETAVRASRGLPRTDYPTASAADWIVPAVVGVAMGAVAALIQSRLLVGIVAGLGWGAAIEASRRRMNFA